MPTTKSFVLYQVISILWSRHLVPFDHPEFMSFPHSQKFHRNLVHPELSSRCGMCFQLGQSEHYFRHHPPWKTVIGSQMGT